VEFVFIVRNIDQHYLFAVVWQFVPIFPIAYFHTYTF